MAGTQAIVVFIDDDNVVDYQWGGTQLFVIGSFQYAAAHNAPINGFTNAPTSKTLTFPCKIRMTKSGNDVLFATGPIGGALGAPFYTASGVLAGKTTGYIKALAAAAEAAQYVKVRVG
jgi:hypothetical protein